MADNLRSKVDMTEEKKVENILGDKATGGPDADADHVPNVAAGLKAYDTPPFTECHQVADLHISAINNPNTSEEAKKEAAAKLETLPAKLGGQY
jgi:hypothetical protein